MPGKRKQDEEDGYESFDEDVDVEAVWGGQPESDGEAELSGEEAEEEGGGFERAMNRLLTVPLPKKKRRRTSTDGAKAGETGEGASSGSEDEEGGKEANPIMSMNRKKERQLAKEKMEEEIAREARRERKKKAKGHVKPTYGKDAGMEKQLKRIANRGVVQLFNAVNKHQRTLKEKSSSVRTLHKQAQVDKMSKSSFLDLLTKGGTEVVGGDGKTKKKKTTTSNDNDSRGEAVPSMGKADADNEGSRWDVLADDFMAGSAKMKDFDKSDELGRSASAVDRSGRNKFTRKKVMPKDHDVFGRVMDDGEDSEGASDSD